MTVEKPLKSAKVDEEKLEEIIMKTFELVESIEDELCLVEGQQVERERQLQHEFGRHIHMYCCIDKPVHFVSILT
jgi:hypothetical protein